MQECASAEQAGRQTAALAEILACCAGVTDWRLQECVRTEQARRQTAALAEILACCADETRNSGDRERLIG